MVYGDTGRYPLYIQSTLSFLRYWLKLRRMTTERFPKQALIMMQNDIDNNGSRNIRSWASDIKHCLESYNKNGTQRCPVAKDLQHIVLSNHLTWQKHI